MEPRLPETFDPVGDQDAVAAEERDVSGQALGHDGAVERVAMMEGEARNRVEVSGRSLRNFDAGV